MPSLIVVSPACVLPSVARAKYASSPVTSRLCRLETRSPSPRFHASARASAALATRRPSSTSLRASLCVSIASVSRNAARDRASASYPFGTEGKYSSSIVALIVPQVATNGSAFCAPDGPAEWAPDWASPDFSVEAPCVSAIARASFACCALNAEACAFRTCALGRVGGGRRVGARSLLPAPDQPPGPETTPSCLPIVFPEDPSPSPVASGRSPNKPMATHSSPRRRDAELHWSAATRPGARRTSGVD